MYALYNICCVLQMCVETQTELSRLEQKTRQLTEELKTTKNDSQQLKLTLEETERDKKVITAFKNICTQKHKQNHF